MRSTAILSAYLLTSTVFGLPTPGCPDIDDANPMNACKRGVESTLNTAINSAAGEVESVAAEIETAANLKARGVVDNVFHEAEGETLSLGLPGANAIAEAESGISSALHGLPVRDLSSVDRVSTTSDEVVAVVDTVGTTLGLPTTAEVKSEATHELPTRDIVDAQLDSAEPLEPTIKKVEGLSGKLPISSRRRRANAALDVDSGALAPVEMPASSVDTSMVSIDNKRDADLSGLTAPLSSLLTRVFSLFSDVLSQLSTSSKQLDTLPSHGMTNADSVLSNVQNTVTTAASQIEDIGTQMQDIDFTQVPASSIRNLWNTAGATRATIEGMNKDIDAITGVSTSPEELIQLTDTKTAVQSALKQLDALSLPADPTSSL